MSSVQDAQPGREVYHHLRARLHLTNKAHTHTQTRKAHTHRHTRHTHTILGTHTKIRSRSQNAGLVAEQEIGRLTTCVLGTPSSGR